ncbi:MAG TPA: DUF6599 family protein [Terriglobia bacterium]|nr:DUF6599 family protein [Terriglobia bacterium]
MWRRWFHVGLVLVVCASVSAAQDRQTPLPSLLGELQKIPGLESKGTPVQYDAGMLEAFDKDLAPTLRLYGAKAVAEAEVRILDSPVKVTLFQMLDAPAAYGVYTYQRTATGGEPTPIVLGAASFRRQNQVYFWQSNYAVRVEGSEAARDQVAKSLSRSILGRSQKPPVAAYLPTENLVEGTEKYLLNGEKIDRGVGIDPENLGFDSSAEAAIATYRVNGRLAHLLLVLYPTQHIAKKYTDAIDGTAGPSPFRKRAGPLLAVVYGSASETMASSILSGVNHQFKVTWDEPLPGLGLGTMLITIFTFIGLGLAFTTMVGISYGGLRVFVKSRYPDRVFDRPQSMEIIQLKLAEGVTDRQIEERSGSSRP